MFANEFRLPATAAEAGLDVFSGAAGSGAEGELRLIAFRAASAERPVSWQPPPTVARPTRQGEIAVTSACFSPLGPCVLGLGYVRRTDIASGSLADPAGTFADIEIVPRPFYDSGKRRPRTAWTT